MTQSKCEDSSGLNRSLQIASNLLASSWNGAEIQVEQHEDVVEATFKIELNSVFSPNERRRYVTESINSADGVISEGDRQGESSKHRLTPRGDIPRHMRNSVDVEQGG